MPALSMEDKIKYFPLINNGDIQNACEHLVLEANGYPMPKDGQHEYQTWYNAWGSSGYRNADTVNGMIAFVRIHGSVDTYGHYVWDERVDKMYLLWLESHVSEEDYEEMCSCRERVISYIPKYAEDPIMYGCSSFYWPDAAILEAKRRQEGDDN